MRRLALAAVVAALIGAHPAVAQESTTVARGELVGGRDVAAWTVAYNRWLLHFTRSELMADRSACLEPPAGGPVTFLAATARGDEHVASADCTVRAGQYLLLSGPQMTCANAVPLPPRYPPTAAGLERCARDNWPVIADPHPRLVLDGQAIPTGGIVRPPAFRVKLPGRDNLFGSSGVRRARAALVGRPTLIKPLAPGVHTLIEGIHYRVTHNMVTVYKLTVVQESSLTRFAGTPA
jgi:hypothetical protein